VRRPVRCTGRADVITWASGTCIEGLYDDGSDRCYEWVGKGFHVTAVDGGVPGGPDVPGDGFSSEFMLKNEENQGNMLFERADPFTLRALNIQLGGFADIFDGCASPMEVRSSKGGVLRVEPPAADTFCYAYALGQGYELRPYPWDLGYAALAFSGAEWTDIDWVYVGFADWKVYPWPKYSTAMVESLAFVPEPSMLLLFGSGAAAVAFRRRAHRRRR
jgi:hypothetical protein